MLTNTSSLLAEGDSWLRGALAAQLSADGAVVHHAFDRDSAFAQAATHRIDALIVGTLDTPASTAELIRAVRAFTGRSGEPVPTSPIVALAGARDEMAMLRCFEAGVDDVAARRASYPVLRARLLTALGRAGRHAVAISGWRVGPLDVNCASREVRLRGTLVRLSKKEFALLAALASDPERVFTREELLRDVWGFRSSGQTRTLDSHAARLRRKLAAQGDGFIVNVWGVGYRLTDRPARELEVAA